MEGSGWVRWVSSPALSIAPPVLACCGMDGSTMTLWWRVGVVCVASLSDGWSMMGVATIAVAGDVESGVVVVESGCGCGC